jgi:hypothetical protein
MDCKRKVFHIFKDNPRGSQLRGRLRNRWWNCPKADISKCKITNWKERSKTELIRRSPLRRRRSSLGYSTIKEEKEEEEKTEEEKKNKEKEKKIRRR